MSKAERLTIRLESLPIYFLLAINLGFPTSFRMKIAAMDPLSITANVIGIIQAPVSLSRALQTRYHEAIAERTEREVSLLARNYGEKMASVITLLSPQTARQYEILDTNVLNGGDEEIRVFRQTITDESNMTAIAVGSCSSA